MATRLHYAVPIARQLALSAARRFRPGGFAASLRRDGLPFVIVTGAGRSGTSAVARVLHESGVPMGENFGPPTEHNPVGFYEELPVCDLNDRIMKECGIDRLERWPSRATVLAIGTQYAATMRALAANEAVGGWKDPRFGATLEAWLQQLRSAPKVVLCLRSPEAFVRSVTRVYGLVEREAVEQRWANLHRRLLDVIRDYRLDAICIEYERLMAHPNETVAELSRFVSHPLDARFIESDARHYDYDVPARYAALYEEVRALGRHSVDRPARAPMPVADDSAAYVDHVRAIDAAVAAARTAWDEQGKLADGSASEQDGALRIVAHASEAYAVVLEDAQAELGALRTPLAFARYHELTQAWIDRERLTVELFQQAARGERPVGQALEAWRRFSAPDALEGAQHERAREYERALRKSERDVVRVERSG
ncbi:MAG: hypothetical protein WBD55_09325 [Dehalococcoidia bacterium]